MGIFALFADPGLQHLPPYRTFCWHFPWKNTHLITTLCFPSIRNKSVIFTRFVAHYVRWWFLQYSTTIGDDLWATKKNVLFYRLLKFYRTQKSLENDSDIIPSVRVTAYSASLLQKLMATNPNPFPRDAWLFFLWFFFYSELPCSLLHNSFF